jgi:hypothetical protein
MRKKGDMVALQAAPNFPSLNRPVGGPVPVFPLFAGYQRSLSRGDALLGQQSHRKLAIAVSPPAISQRLVTFQILLKNSSPTRFVGRFRTEQAEHSLSSL